MATSLSITPALQAPGGGAVRAGASRGPAQGLAPQAQARVDELKQADREVRAHEAAHLAAAGGLARGGATYTFERGPDGRYYAVAGEVPLDTSPVEGDPRATLAKAQQIRAAALAPADPSAQDQSVAAAAAALTARALAELGRAQTTAGSQPPTLDLLA